jgi:hypothetical protein
MDTIKGRLTMHKIAYFAIVTVSALSLFACSQTVEAPSQDDDGEALYSSSSIKSNSKAKSSSSKSSEQEDDFTDDDDFFDEGGLVIDTSKITRSAIEFTGEKRDCDFSVDDSVWTIKQVDSNSSSISYITFDEKTMEIKMDVEAKNDPDKTCEESLGIWTFTIILVGGKDVDGNCTDDGFAATGTLVDSTRSIRDKKDVYKEICN